MTHRRPIFSSPGNVLVTSSRLTALKDKIDSIAADLATLDGQTEAQRRENVALRNTVLGEFETLGDV